MLGNLVALPLHFGSRSENKTVFIDIDTMQHYGDQWNILRNIKKLSQYQLHILLKENIAQAGIYQDSLMPWEIKKEKPITFPKLTNAVLHEALYIEKLELSKQLLNKLQRLASFLNPEFYKLQNLRRSTYNTPRVVSLFDMNERYIIVPRGLTAKIKQLFKSHNATLIIEDKRFINKTDKPKLCNRKLQDNKIL